MYFLYIEFVLTCSVVSGWYTFHKLSDTRVDEELNTLANEDIKEAIMLATIIPRAFTGTTVLTKKGYAWS